MSKKKQEYVVIWNPDKEDLDKIQVGDYVKLNELKKPLRVRAVSENFFIMTQVMFGEICYSICDKRPSPFNRNYIVEGYPTVGMDNSLFGRYDYSKQEDIEQCLRDLEDENHQTEISVRRSCALKGIQYKRGK